jgi:2-polyprenyl-3-methyl-5-hydroxy-6-metoxy-1,4-benzoquinol methylase
MRGVADIPTKPALGMYMNKITIREAVRHGLHITSLDRLLMKRRIMRGLDVGSLFAADRRQVFEDIYSRGVWRNNDDERVSCSGAGSELAATVGLRANLPIVLAQIGGQSMVDVGCGDFTWMQHVDLGVKYLGVDVVRSVVDVNRKLYGSVEREFRCIDAVAESLPTADVALCREVLFHLSFADAKKLLGNVKAAGVKYLIATTDSATDFNSDIRTGDFRVLNLRKRPFRFPVPDGWIADEAVQAGRGLGVWRTADL